MASPRLAVHRPRVPESRKVPQKSLVADSVIRAVEPENVSVELIVVNVPQFSSLTVPENPPAVAVKNPVSFTVPVTAGSSTVSPKSVIDPVIVSCAPAWTTIMRMEPVSVVLEKSEEDKCKRSGVGARNQPFQGARHKN